MLAPFITAAVLKAINVQICMPDKIIFRLYPFFCIRKQGYNRTNQRSQNNCRKWYKAKQHRFVLEHRCGIRNDTFNYWYKIYTCTVHFIYRYQQCDYRQKKTIWVWRLLWASRWRTSWVRSKKLSNRSHSFSALILSLSSLSSKPYCTIFTPQLGQFGLR